MIRSFASKETAGLWNGESVKRLPAAIQDRALVKLRLIDASSSVEDLRISPGNRLEALKGNRSGQFSIRINNQWRICFEWKDSDAWNVEIVDYH